jgi:hypothetical protein
VSLSHDQRRLMQHRIIDPKRFEFGRASIGAASWCHGFSRCFGDPKALLHYMRDTARVIKFRARQVKSGSDGRC